MKTVQQLIKNAIPKDDSGEAKLSHALSVIFSIAFIIRGWWNTMKCLLCFSSHHLIVNMNFKEQYSRFFKLSFFWFYTRHITFPLNMILIFQQWLAIQVWLNHKRSFAIVRSCYFMEMYIESLFDKCADFRHNSITSVISWFRQFY